MKTFEQNLEELKKTMEDESQGFNKKSEELIVQMQTELQEGAVCPLAQPHKEFINFLRVNGEIPVSFKAWANGVRDYEIALQLPSSKKVEANVSKSIAQPATEKGIDPAMINEIAVPIDEPKIPIKTDVTDWKSDL